MSGAARLPALMTVTVFSYNNSTSFRLLFFLLVVNPGAYPVICVCCTVTAFVVFVPIIKAIELPLFWCNTKHLPDVTDDIMAYILLYTPVTTSTNSSGGHVVSTDTKTT